MSALPERVTKQSRVIRANVEHVETPLDNLKCENSWIRASLRTFREFSLIYRIVHAYVFHQEARRRIRGELTRRPDAIDRTQRHEYPIEYRR